MRPVRRKGSARLLNKRAQPNGNGLYVVDSTCSLCGHTLTLSFAGWCGYVCPKCGAVLDRSPYRKKTELEQLAEVKSET